MNENTPQDAPAPPVDHAEQFADAVKVKELMESLMANEGWTFMCKVIRSCIETRDRALDEPLQSMDGAPLQEYTKGARQAYRHIASMPGQIIEDSKAVIEMTAPEPQPIEEQEDGTEEES